MAKPSVSTTLLPTTEISLSSPPKCEVHIRILWSTSRIKSIQGSPSGACLLVCTLVCTHTQHTEGEKSVDYKTRVVSARFGLTFHSPRTSYTCHIRSASDATIVNTLMQQKQSYTIVHYPFIYPTFKTHLFSVHYYLK